MQVASIVIQGRVCRDMYDEHPGLAYFYTDGRRSIDIPHQVPITTAKAIAEAAWRLGQAETADDDGWEQSDGQFTPTRIVLLSKARTTIQCFENNQWVGEFVPQERWAEMLREAAELDSEAAYEAGWDNFSTAEGLRHSASAIRRKVAIAQATASARQAGEDSIRGLSERVLLASARIATLAAAGNPAGPWIATKRGASALGIREKLAGLQEPPIMFDGEPVLLNAWRKGVVWATDFINSDGLSEDD